MLHAIYQRVQDLQLKTAVLEEQNKYLTARLSMLEQFCHCPQRERTSRRGIMAELTVLRAECTVQEADEELRAEEKQKVFIQKLAMEKALDDCKRVAENDYVELIELHCITMIKRNPNPLHQAAFDGESNEVLDRLMDHHQLLQDVNVKDCNGSTPLQLATMSGHLKTVQHLLDRGVDINGTDGDGWTALMYAETNHFDDIVALLRSKNGTL